MAQIFKRRSNALVRASIVLLAAGAAFLVWSFYRLDRSPYTTRQGEILAQPVPFSHDHHTVALGIDCRYCHTAVETSASAGIPPTATCMNCHKQIWAQSPMLEPVRTSYATGEPIRWTRVHDLPDFVYFNHSIHVAKGVACVTCHGRVDQMPLLFQQSSLQMEWCLACHRDPERYTGPVSEVFRMPAHVEPRAAKLVELATAGGAAPVPEEPPANAAEAKNYRVRQLTSCSTCHR